MERYRSGRDQRTRGPRRTCSTDVRSARSSRSSIAEAVGCVLAEAVVAAEDVPPFVNSAVDGYAVRAADVADAPVQLRVVGEVAAGGSHRSGARLAGEAIRIMTGAPMPTGADAAVMVEDTERSTAAQVLIRKRVAARRVGARRRRRRARRAPSCSPPAPSCAPAVAGVLASVNARRCSVVPQARVAVLSDR